MKTDISIAFALFRTLAGYDAIPYSYQAYKVSIFKKILSDNANLSYWGQVLKLTDDSLRREFTNFLISCGKDDEGCVGTKTQFCKIPKNLPPLVLLPDPDSVLQVIKGKVRSKYKVG